jgi:SAM-dependent methyltransferase
LTGSTVLRTSAGKTVVDIGCGGGILAESMAKKGAKVTGIDLSEKALKVADLHSLESGVQLRYELIAAEDHCHKRSRGLFDVVTCMEMLEHVPDPASDRRGMRAARQTRRDVYSSLPSTAIRNPICTPSLAPNTYCACYPKAPTITPNSSRLQSCLAICTAMPV